LQDEEASFRGLTSLVLRDYGLTLRVLRTANSAQYNRSGRPILSVSHAVVLLGAEAIRCLAGGLAVFEHFGQRSPGLKELMLLSLLTANQTRAAAEQVGYPRLEEAYLCGMLCNLGEVLVACYFPREYARILRQVKEENLSGREAAFRVLGFSYEDLGQAVARQWDMPESVLRTIRELGSRPPQGALDAGELLSHLTSFSHGLTSAVYRQEREGARARVRLLIEDYLPVLGLSRGEVDRILETALAETSHTFSALRIPLDSLRLSRQVEAAAAPSQASAPEAGPVVTVPESLAEPVELSGGTRLLEDLTREVEALLSHGGIQLNNVLLMILEAVYRGGPFDRVLFCLVTPGHTHVQGRLGLGEGSEQLREKFRFALSPEGGPIGVALRGRREVFLPAHGVGFAGARTLNLLGAASLGVLPVLVEGVLVGCLYFDRTSDATLPEPQVMLGLARLRDLAAVAIERSRAAE